MKKTEIGSQSAGSSEAGISTDPNLSNPNQTDSVSAVQTSVKSTQSAKSSWYGTEVVEMTDGFGNKIITRTFKDHPRITSISITTPVKGQQTVEVFGQNGERRELSAYMAEKALTGNGDEIADIAGIFQTKREAPQMPQLNLSDSLNLKAENAPPAPEVNEAPVNEVENNQSEKTETATSVKSEQKNEVLQSQVQNEDKIKPNEQR